MTAPEQAQPRASASSPGADAPGAATTDADGDHSYEIVSPVPADGVDMWRLAVESQTLDANSRYAYVLWCRDFADTSVIARRSDGLAVGYVTGYLRPQAGNTLLIWQVCVDPVARGAGLAGRLLDAVWDQAVATAGADRMETTVTPDNESSIRLFTSFARRHHTSIEREDLFGPDLLGDAHEPEHLYRIGPIARSAGVQDAEARTAGVHNTEGGKK
ncbi:diaminobutyrate acetyltransferase [Pseudonocardia parietis]|uniref:L-2,4-diaminobutyric acid acetyltransferase n=1 Tax=Pseudonocardia parietis TaxID=570936 RepID=A0ABS4VNS5_9PSEU|nr:diaminobutyrate acetyltransferase [Pseudonocardia parietis]MBP2365426.1 L-2,4-diaminobutyric acid acetyltransferase [Pseudonocardia parietis]